MTVSTRTIDLHNDLTVSVAEYGENSDGTAVLVLHGGAGPRSVAGFAEAMSEHAYTIVPTHPGFDGTPRPDATDSIADLATAYLDLLDELDLRHVVVVGSSFGGWVAAEMIPPVPFYKHSPETLIQNTARAMDAIFALAD